MNSYNWKLLFLPWAFTTFAGYGLAVQSQLNDPSFGGILAFFAFFVGFSCGHVRKALDDHADQEESDRFMRRFNKELEKRHQRSEKKERRDQQRNSEEGP